MSLETPGDGSLLIRNDSKKEINIGLWSLADTGKTYVIPENTIVLAGEGVRFAASITGLSGTPAAKLLYPNSALAAAATVSADSPLRGERVTKEEMTPVVPAIAPAAPAKSTAGEVLGASTSTPAPAESKASPSLWLSLGALTVLLAGGAAGVRYLQLRPAQEAETLLSAEEFEIE